MSKESQNLNPQKYWAFISYRHADNKTQDRDWATWLHQEIERYEVPAELEGAKNKRGDTIPERIYPVFRDEESLPTDADLASSISIALDRSLFLVVLCSPRAVESQYVAQEIEHFKNSGKDDRIIAAIIAGEPGDKKRECFPVPLREIVTPDGKLSEPIAADFRLSDGSEGFTSPEAYKKKLLKTLPKKQADNLAEVYDERLQLMKLKIIAGIIGVPLEVLRDRDKAFQLLKAKKRQKLLTVVVSVVSLLAIIATVTSFYAINQKNLAEKNESIANEQRKKTEEALEGAQETLSFLTIDFIQATNEYLPKAVQLEAVEEAIDHHNRLSTLMRNAQITLSYTEELREAVLYEQEANAKIELGVTTEADIFLARKNIVKIFRDLDSEYPGNIKIMRELCVAISNLSSLYLHSNNNVEEAKLILKEALTVLDQPTKNPWLLDLRIQVLTKLATAYRLTDSSDSQKEALKIINRAIALGEIAIAQHPDVAELYRSMIYSHLEKYSVLLKTKKHIKATKELEIAVSAARLYQSKKPSSHSAMHTFGIVSLQLIYRLHYKKMKIPTELVIESGNCISAAIDRDPLNFLYTYTLADLLYLKSLIYYREQKYDSFEVTAKDYLDSINKKINSPFLTLEDIIACKKRIKEIENKLNSSERPEIFKDNQY